MSIPVQGPILSRRLSGHAARFSLPQNSAEVLEAKAHPGGLLRGILARRAFHVDVVIQVQARARRYLARKRFESLREAVLPQIFHSLERRVIQLATEIKVVGDEMERLIAAMNAIESRADELQREWKPKRETVEQLDAHLTQIQQDVKCADLTREISAKEAALRRIDLDAMARDSAIEELARKLEQAQQRAGKMTLVDALADAKRMSVYLDIIREPSSRILAHPSPDPWHSRLNATSPTFYKLDRMKSPRAPKKVNRPTHLNITSSTRYAHKHASSVALGPWTSSRGAQSPRSGHSNRYSLPASGSPSFRVSIVETTPLQPHDLVQSRLEAYYKPSLVSLQYDVDEITEEANSLPIYAEELLADLSRETVEKDVVSLEATKLRAKIDEKKLKRRWFGIFKDKVL